MWTLWLMKEENGDEWQSQCTLRAGGWKKVQTHLQWIPLTQKNSVRAIVWGLHCTQRGQSQEGQEGLGWGIWFHWTIFFISETMYLWNPTQETWTFLKHHDQKGSRLSSHSLLPIVPACIWPGIFSSVWGRVVGSQHSCSLRYEGFPPSFPGIQNTCWNLEFSFQGNDIVTKIFPRTRMAAVWGLLFWWGFFGLFDGFFKISAYNIEWMLPYFLPAQKILVEIDAV